MDEVVFSVHATKPDDGGAIEVIFRTESEARRYAEERSRDFRVVSTSVTRFCLGVLGDRQPIAWYVDGKEQPQRFDRPNLYPTDGFGAP